MSSQRGTALLVVLWMIVLLSTLLTGLATTVQTQLRQSLWQRNEATGQLAAQAGLAIAVQALSARNVNARWPTDGALHIHTVDTATVQVSVRSERAKVDLNAASLEDIQKLIAASGAGALETQQLIGALVEKRKNDTPIKLLEEFRELPGMSYQLYRRLLPSLTVWSGEARPDPALASPTVRNALGLPRVKTAASNPGEILTVTSRSTLLNGHRTTLRVTLVLSTPKEGAKPYRVLRWQE